MEECVFCKIARKEIPSFTVFEDDETVAFLDINPRSKGMCIVVPKKHYTHFDEDLQTSRKVMESALIVAYKAKKALQPDAVFISMIGGQIPHFHVRVYPVYRDQIPLFENRPIEVTREELESIAMKLKNAETPSIVVEQQTIEVKEEKPEEEHEEKLSKEEKFWMERSFKVG